MFIIKYLPMDVFIVQLELGAGVIFFAELVENFDEPSKMEVA